MVFWFGIAAMLYAYIGFPLILSLIASRKREARPETAPASPVPVTVIVPAHNEEGSIGARLDNLLAADYPPGLMQVIVVSDASTDRTNAIAAGYAPRGVRLVVQERRLGKTAGLNRAMGDATGDVVIFTDANAIFERGTIRALTERFDDPRVGLVTGYTKYSVGERGEVTDATNAYTSLERAIKRGESAWGCCVGADGAIFAMRRTLYRPLRDDDINDFVLPLGVIDQGYRSLLADDVYCSETSGKDLESEFRRQSRITNRSLRAIWRHAHLLDPRRSAVLSMLLFSHKVARFLVPWFLLASVAALLVLAVGDPAFRSLALVALVGLVLTALVAAWPALAKTAWSRPLRLLAIFAAINVAMLHGWWKFLSGDQEVTWQHDRVLSK